MNLVIALLSTRSYITAEKIRSSVAGYADSASDEAFSRMFERDKNELRDLGIPLETGRVSSFDPIEGYRINRDAYALPAVELTGDEAAAVAVATQLWESPELITATQGALLKLRAAGVDVDPLAPIAIASPAGRVGLRGSEDVLGLLLSAIDAGQAVQFPHRPSRTDPYTVRTVEPWGVVTEKGRWYLVGHDRDRGATRTFRLSRIGDEVTPIGPAGAVTRPVDADLREIVANAVGDATDGRAGSGLGRRRAGNRAAARRDIAGFSAGERPRRRRHRTRHRNYRSCGARHRRIRPRRCGAGTGLAARRGAGPVARPRWRGGGMTPVSTRLVRLLNMVPYFQANPRVTRAQAASDLGVSRQAAGGGPRPAVAVRPARLRPGGPDRLRIHR